MARRLDGKVAVVTGGGSGMGQAFAKALHREGAKVVVADISGDEEVTVDELGEGSLAFHADVRKTEDVQAMLDAAVDTYGSLDVLCNNAGIDGDFMPTADCPEENWDAVVAVNLRAVFLGMKYAIPIMLRGGGGSIINTASVAGLVGFPLNPGYTAAKGGVVLMTKGTALEYAQQGIRINAVCPGAIDTPLLRKFAGTNRDMLDGIQAATPMGRLADPSEVAAMVVFLASDEASFVTGAAFAVDGGYLAQ